MSEPVRFFLDEHQDRVLLTALRRAGIDADSVVTAGRRTLSDESHIEWARREGRVIVTFDPDFVEIAWSGVDHAGIAYCHGRKLSIGALIRRLTEIHATETAESMSGRVVFL